MTDNTVKGILVIIAVLSVIIGFFLKVIPSEMFSAIVGGLVMQYFQANKIQQLSKKVDDQEVEIQSLKNG